MPAITPVAPGGGGGGGAPGESAFQAWLKQPGNAGKTEADYVAWMRGPRGATRFTSGSVPTAGTLPAGWQAGDEILHTATGDLYVIEGSTPVLKINLKGAPGATGGPVALDFADGVPGVVYNGTLSLWSAPHALRLVSGGMTCGVAPTAALTLTVEKNGTAAATLTIAAGATTSGPLSAPVTLAQGDRVRIALSGANGVAADLTYSLRGEPSVVDAGYFSLADGVSGVVYSGPLALFAAPRAFTWSAGGMSVSAAVTTALTLTVEKNGTAAATLTIPVGAAVSGPLSAPVAFVQGDRISLFLSGASGTAQDLAYWLQGAPT